MKSKLLLLLTLVSVLGLTAFRASAQEPTIGKITIGTELNVGDRMNPVSYTHLDVYKRQV